MVADQDLELSTEQSRLQTPKCVTVAPVPVAVPLPVPVVTVPVPVPVPASPMSTSPSSTPAMAASVASDEWMSEVPRGLRERFVETIAAELTRIARDSDAQHVRNCATRFEAHVLERSTSQVEYVRRLEQHIASLRQQGPRSMGRPSPSLPRAGSQTRRHHSHSHSHSRRHRPAHASHAHLSPAELAARDDAYFARLRRMRTAYRDEVAIVYRELCRVHAVIQSSRALPRREATHLGDFVQNLKKVMHLLEQQPDEMHGIIPARKRTLEYLNVVETHIQRKVLPMLHRLRHTYSTLLRPIVLHYLKCNARALRRL